MTLIGVHVQQDQVTVVTDTFAYGPMMRRTAHTSKIHPLLHLDALITSRGDSQFGIAWTIICEEEAFGRDFDGLVAHGPQMARDAWEQAHPINRDNPQWVAAYLIGYSTSAGEFQCHMFCADRDFEPEPIGQTHVIPSPLGARPSAPEVRWCSPGEDVTGEDREYAETLLAEWQRADPLEASLDMSDPIALAKAAIHARTQRATAKFASDYTVPIHGKLIGVTLTQGHLVMSNLLEWDDDDEVFLQAMQGSLHPASQLGPCPCGETDKTFLECHLAPHLDKPCGCGAGSATLRDCCAVELPLTATGATA